MLKWRTVEPAGQMPSVRPAHGAGPVPLAAASPVSPSQGAPGVAVRRERRALADVRAQQRERDAPVDRVEQDDRSGHGLARKRLNTSPGYAVG